MNLPFKGRTPYLYRHDLVALTQRNLTQRISRPMNKLPEKYVPKRLAITVRIPETKLVVVMSKRKQFFIMTMKIYFCIKHAFLWHAFVI